MSVLQLHQARQESGTESLACLPRHQAGQVIDRDDAERWAGCRVDCHCGVGKGGVNLVDGDGVVWVRRVTRDVADDGELAILAVEAGGLDEWWDGVREVDAVYEDLVYVSVVSLSLSFCRRLLKSGELTSVSRSSG